MSSLSGLMWWGHISDRDRPRIGSTVPLPGLSDDVRRTECNINIDTAQPLFDINFGPEPTNHPYCQQSLALVQKSFVQVLQNHHVMS